MKKQVLVADQEDVKRVSSANEKLDASMAREDETKAASQKTIDVLEISSKSKMRENGKRAARLLEKEREPSMKKVCR